MTTITKEHLFQWNMEQVINRIESDYGKEIMQEYESNKDCLTLEDWLHYHPDVLGRYVLEQLSNNFDFNFDNVADHPAPIDADYQAVVNYLNTGRMGER